MGSKRRIGPILIGLVAWMLLALAGQRPAEAGCGCNKPPPLPASIIPGVAYHGMAVTLYDPSLQPGQKWAVTFNNGLQPPLTVTGVVKYLRDIADSTGKTKDAQLVVNVPNLAPGPTSISAINESNASETITVPNSGFVMIGNPATVKQQSGGVEFDSYTTAVGLDNTVYIAVGGLNKVCDAMQFHAVMQSYPLRFGDNDVLIFNWQGYYIDALTAASKNHFSITPSTGPDSDQLDYFRHSFQIYCKQHAPGGSKQVDPKDKNWHRDGTPHVDYAAVIFAIKGHFDNSTVPTPGILAAPMSLENELGDGSGPWEPEPPDSGEE